MTIEYWTLAVEIIGSLGIMVTLVYLAAQMRQNTRQTYAENLEIATTKYVNAAYGLMRTDEDADLLRRGLHDYNGLSPAQKARFYSWTVDLYRGFEAIAIKHRSGLVEPRYFVAAQKLMASWIACPGFHASWQVAKQVLPETAVEEIEDAVRTYEGCKPRTELLSFLRLTEPSL